MNKRIKAIIASAVVMTSTLTSLGFQNYGSVNANEIRKEKNVIMLIADGMSTEAITLAREVKGSDLAMDEISTGSVITSWAKGPITDSAPGATAYSAGHKTNNKYIATNTDNTPLATIIEGAESVGKATGIIATSEITHATPADFTAHINDRSKYNSILRQQINSEMEVVLGGGFNKPSGFKDVADFNAYYNDRVSEIKSEGFEFVETKEQMLNFNGDKLWGSFAKSDLKYDYDRINDNDETEPSLSEMTNKAIEVLNKEDNGFFLMVEGSKVDWAAHSNDTVGIVSDILAFDEAVKEAIDFAKADGNTVVVVTTDHGNSGITIGSDFYNKNIGSYDKATFDATVNKLKAARITEGSFQALISGKSDLEIAALAKQYYSFDLTSEEISIAKTSGIKEVIAKRVGIGYTTGGHTGEEVYLGVYAPSQTELLEGVVDNTEVNRYMQRVLFGGEILDSKTKEIFINGKAALSSIEGTTVTIDESKAEAPKVIVEKLGNVIELELYTNNYTVNGEAKELKTVMPYINGEFFVSQELLEIVKNLQSVEDEFNYYYGDFHNHTGYSDGKVGTTPRDAFEFAYEQEDVDFMAITDHEGYLANLNNGKWEDTISVADEMNEDGRFVAIAGYEQTQNFGHMNVMNLQEKDKPETIRDINDWYTKLKGMDYSIAQFNHPDGEDYGDFEKFRYEQDLDEVINLYELGCGDSTIENAGYYFRWSRYDTYYNQYYKALDKGWHIAPTNNQDNHVGNWYKNNECRGVVLAEDLTRDSIFDAIKNRRVYATEDKNQKIDYTVNGEVMGTILDKPENLTAKIKVEDIDVDDAISKIEIITDGGKIIETKKNINSTEVEWEVNLNKYKENRYFVVKITKEDGGISLTAPVWTGHEPEITDGEEENKLEVGLNLSKDEVNGLEDTLDISMTGLNKLKNNSWVGIYEENEKPGTINCMWWKYFKDLPVNENGELVMTFDPKAESSGKPEDMYRYQVGKTYKVIVFNGGGYEEVAKYTFKVNEAIADKSNIDNENVVAGGTN